MTIHLSKDQARFVNDAVRDGVYASEDAVVNDALDRLRRAMPAPAKAPGKGAKRTRSAPRTPKAPLTEAQLQQHMLKIGLMTHLPDSEADFDDPDDEPITIKGEPLSETIIRERR
jgi:Arc/MetJ-type ribon-helix-helix transcriptional regulator